MTAPRLLSALCLCVLALLSTSRAAAETRDLIIVAGQSNAVGFDAKPSAITPDDIDQQIMFWWRCGDPPPDAHDSTSGQKWLTLRPQPLGDPSQEKEPRQYGNFAQPEGGFGPELSLGRMLAQGGSKLAVIKVAFSGTGVRQDWNPQDEGTGGACYRAMVAEIDAAMNSAKAKGIELKPRAFAWVQGESDAKENLASHYADNLDDMLTALRLELKAPALPALIAVNTRFGSGKNQHMPTVIAQQRLLGASDPRCVYVDTSMATIANGVHFDGPGTLTVGKLFADALLQWERERTGQPKVRVVTLGDSITKGVRSGVTQEQTFASRLDTLISEAKMDVVNVGIGGERTDQALKRLQQIVDLKPHIVTVMYGTNDSYIDQGKTTSRITVEAYKSNLSLIAAQLLDAGIQPVLMTPPRWSQQARNNGLGRNPNLQLEPYVEACRQVAQQWSLPLVDHYQYWQQAEKDGADLHTWTTDGCHPNPPGHEVLSKSMAPVIRTAVAVPAKIRKRLLDKQAIKVVCFGDSVTGVYQHTGGKRAYTDLIGEGLTRVGGVAPAMTNAGISGHTTANGLARLEKDVLQHNPDVVTVMFGLNDMTRVSLEDYRKNLHSIVKQCQDAGAEVILATPNNVTDTPRRPTDKLLKYCAVVREIAREMDCRLYDSYHRFEAARRVDPKRWESWMSDPIHPNMRGHAEIAAGFFQAMTGLRCDLSRYAIE